MATKWLTVAPNGNFVTINTGGSFDRTYTNGQFITDKALAEAHPDVFIPCADEKPQILTEVTPPKVEDVKVEEEVKEPVKKSSRKTFRK